MCRTSTRPPSDLYSRTPSSDVHFLQLSATLHIQAVFLLCFEQFLIPGDVPVHRPVLIFLLRSASRDDIPAPGCQTALYSRLSSGVKSQFV